MKLFSCAYEYYTFKYIVDKTIDKWEIIIIDYIYKINFNQYQQFCENIVFKRIYYNLKYY